MRHRHTRSAHHEFSSQRHHVTPRVRDDGRGFDDKALARPPGGRHWGLPGMQDRARALPATLQIWSRPGAGTEIELRIAGGVAYA